MRSQFAGSTIHHWPNKTMEYTKPTMHSIVYIALSLSNYPSIIISTSLPLLPTSKGLECISQGQKMIMGRILVILDLLSALCYSISTIIIIDSNTMSLGKIS